MEALGRRLATVTTRTTTTTTTTTTTRLFNPNLSFALYMGLPPAASSPSSNASALVMLKPRLYTRTLSQQDAAALYLYEDPNECLGYCPLPPPQRGEESLRNAFIANTTSSLDLLQPAQLTSPGTILALQCDPGFLPSSGSQLLTCSFSAGSWNWSDPTTSTVQWLDCCNYDPNFCPQINLTALLATSWAPSDPCNESNGTNGTTSSIRPGVLRSLGATASLFVSRRLPSNHGNRHRDLWTEP